MELPVSPSLKISNLEYFENGEINYLFVHTSRQIIWINNHLEKIRSLDFENETYEELENHLLHLKCLSISSSSNPILVGTSNRYIKMYSLPPNDAKLLQTPIRLNQKMNIVSLNQLTSLSFVLVSNNSIQIFTYKSKEFHQTTKTILEENIICSSSDGVSGLVLLENLGLSLWKGTDKKLMLQKRFPLPINCKAIQAQLNINWIIIATISGQIQFVNRETGKLACEIQAHSSALTSIIDWNDFIISSSEDHSVRIFKILNNSKESFEIKFEKQKKFDNQIPIGVCVMKKQNQTLCGVSCFENLKIETFQF